MDRTKGNLVGLLDPADMHLLAGRHWHKDRYGYVKSNTVCRHSGKRKMLLLHRLVVEAEDGDIVDHVNRDCSDNRRSNLRKCSVAENCRNTAGKSTRKTSVYKGVRRHGISWEARITVGYVTHYLGSFPSAELAHSAVVMASRRLHGEFSYYADR